MTLKSTINSTLHRLFFPGLKVPPKASWQEELKSYGQIEELSISRNSKKIAAILLRPQTEKIRGTVIFAHPISRKAKYFFSDGLRIKNYLNASYRVVLFDFNGFGESDRIDLYFWKDIATVIHYVREKFPNEPLILHGLSFGSFNCIRATKELPTNSKVILENNSRSMYDYWKRWPHKALVIKILEVKLWAPSFMRDMNMIQALKELNRPDLQFLFITCSDDKITPANEMLELADYLTAPKFFLHIENAKHLEGPIVAEQEYAQALNRFLEDTKKRVGV